MVALNIPDYLNFKNAYNPTYEQYASDAAFLWILRSIATNQPHYNAHDLFELEQRIETQLDGLMTSIDMGWQACDDALQLQEPGELFTAMAIAMRSREIHKIQKAVETGLENDLATPGLISAMGWLPADIANPWTERFLKGKEMNHKYLGIAVCSVRRQDPGEVLNNILQRDDCQQHEKLYARALRLVGELRRQDCMPEINSAMTVESSEIRFWANCSAVLLGHRSSAHNLQEFVFNAGPHQNQAIQLAFRSLPIETARKWVSKLAEDESQVRVVIKAAGALGDPHAINWLIEKMKTPELARLAGEAFANITGVELKQSQLLVDPTDQPPSPPDEHDIVLDEDEHLPCPDAEKVMALWRNYGQNFSIGHRYFMGHLIAADTLKETLAKGNQRQRHAAALELALNEQGVPLPNTSARVLSL